MTSAGLNSLRQKEYQISVKNWIFDDPFHKKGLVLVIWVLGMIKSSGSVIFLMKWGCWGHWGHWGCWGRWGHWGCRSFKAWKTTTEDFRIIQAFEFSFIFRFSKKNFWVESWNVILNFCTFSVRGCWGQLMSFFWKLVDETQMCNPPEATRHHNLIKLLILLPLRAIYFRTFQCEIPCSRKPGDYNGTIVFEIDIMKTGVAISFHSIPFFPPFFQK